jgi:hypothetical protein
MQIWLFNNDPYGNNVEVRDRNAGDAVIFNGHVPAQAKQAVDCRASDAGYGNITTKIDDGQWTGRPWLNEGDTVNLF